MTKSYLPQIRDQDLIYSLNNRDKKAISLIYEKYGFVLLGAIHKVVKDIEISETIFQEAMVEIWRNGPSYDPCGMNLFPWMLHICQAAANKSLHN